MAVEDASIYDHFDYGRWLNFHIGKVFVSHNNGWAWEMWNESQFIIVVSNMQHLSECFGYPCHFYYYLISMNWLGENGTTKKSKLLRTPEKMVVKNPS